MLAHEDAFLERCVAAAPDMLFAIGNAASDYGNAVLERLASRADTANLPVAILHDDDSLGPRLQAFRHGAVAVIRRHASADAIAEQMEKIAKETPARSGRAEGEFIEATLDELLQQVASELRTGILSVESGPEKSPVRLVFDGGRPVADALERFVEALRPLVARAEPLKYAFQEESPARLQLVEPEDLSESPELGVFKELRALIIDGDSGRADALAQEMRSRGALVVVSDPAGQTISRARELDPEVVILDQQELETEAFELVRNLRQDPRLKWASLVIVNFAEVWPDRSSGFDLRRLALRVKPLVQQVRSLHERLSVSDAFDTRLEICGPSRLIRGLLATSDERTIHMRVRGPAGLVDVDLAEGLVVGAEFTAPEGAAQPPEPIQGVDALARLFVMSAARVRIERKDNPSFANIMLPPDEAVALAAAMVQPPESRMSTVPRAPRRNEVGVGAEGSERPRRDTVSAPRPDENSQRDTEDVQAVSLPPVPSMDDLRPTGEHNRRALHALNSEVVSSAVGMTRPSSIELPLAQDVVVADSAKAANDVDPSETATTGADDEAEQAGADEGVDAFAGEIPGERTNADATLPPPPSGSDSAEDSGGSMGGLLDDMDITSGIDLEQALVDHEGPATDSLAAEPLPADVPRAPIPDHRIQIDMTAAAAMQAGPRRGLTTAEMRAREALDETEHGVWSNRSWSALAPPAALAVVALVALAWLLPKWSAQQSTEVESTAPLASGPPASVGGGEPEPQPAANVDAPSVRDLAGVEVIESDPSVEADPSVEPPSDVDPTDEVLVLEGELGEAPPAVEEAAADDSDDSDDAADEASAPDASEEADLAEDADDSKLSEEDRQSSSRARVRRAGRAMRRGDFGRARALLRSGLRRDRRDHHLMEALAKVELRAGRPDMAERWARRAIAKRPKRAGYRELRALALDASGRKAEAEAEWRKVIALEPRNRAARKRLGR